ncbi:hypothetical protein EDC62_0224 [Tibeticola sediminis]|uniref:Uncharacterized protein n=1 Tax=Tibeticola sediminis TaxID=1917811 RepID=A0A3N4UQN0_9BURK|nr:hypothetical protein [Tibeticola sediminis]RPE72533.1 hypothetical protein EDC62_0224 [Tibeticola sediminis]
MRAQIAQAISARVRAVDAALTLTAWGEKQVAVMVERMDIRDTDVIDGRVAVVVQADHIDAVPLAELVVALAAPLRVSAPGLLSIDMSLTSVEERIEEAAAALVAIYRVRGRIDPAAIGSADDLRYTSAYLGVAPWIGAAHEDKYVRVDTEPVIGETSLEDMLP